MDYMEIIVGSIWLGCAAFAMELWIERRKNHKTVTLDELIKIHN